jgi:hypothetical protein
VDRQKWLGLTKGKMPPDDTLIMSLSLRVPHSVMVVGNAEALSEPPPVSSVVDDWEDFIDDLPGSFTAHILTSGDDSYAVDRSLYEDDLQKTIERVIYY